MPLESRTLEFVSWEKTQKCPLVVYADLEAINVGTKSLSQANLRTRGTERQYAASCGAMFVVSGS